ncbi:MAG: hypothetical protein JXB62_03835 [Pirellulales bacterium]|nr:hypothetical protein [Pirellulales bacterium]
MSPTIFWRLIWKEYRMLRGFWICLTVAAVAIQLLAAWFVDQPVEDLVPIVLSVALVMPTLYVLGGAATLFAVERETGTYDFQRALPAASWRSFLGKLTYAVASALLMFAILAPTAYGVSRLRVAQPEVNLRLCAVWGLAAATALVWGMFFSLLTKAPLKAAVMATIVGLFSVYCVAYFAETMFHADFWHVALWILAAAAVVALVDLWLGLRWFREKAMFSWWAARWNRLRIVAAGKSAGASSRPARPGGPLFARLLWQQWRQSSRLLGVLAATSLLLALVGIVMYGLPPRQRGFLGPLGAVSLAALIYLLPPIVGACVFLGDQHARRFRFLAERGAPAPYVWLSRQIVWGAAAACWTALILVAMLFLLFRGMPEADVLQAMGYMIGFIVLAYTSGQLMSMFLRNGAMAVVATVVLCGLLCFWSRLMHAMQISWLWSVIPVPLAMLAATWLRTPRWLLERNGLRGWLWPLLALLLPTAAILTAVPLYRVFEIPFADPGFSPEKSFRPAAEEELAAAELYRRAGELRTSARVLEAEGDLDATWDRYLAALRMADRLRVRGAIAELLNADRIETDVYGALPDWAARPGQTPERIRGALGQLDELARRRPSPSDALEADFFLTRETLSGHLEHPLPHSPLNTEVQLVVYCTRRLPWEKARAFRLLDFLAQRDLERVRLAERQAAEGKRITQPTDELAGPRQQWLETTPFLRLCYSQHASHLVRSILRMETRRRVVRLLLAIEAHQHEHDRLPERLDDLVGPDLDAVPIDPYSGYPFRYFPQGLPTAVPWSEPSSRDEHTLAAGTPLIMSVGPCIHDLGVGDAPERYQVQLPSGYWYQPESDDEVCRRAWLFPLP